MLKLLTTHHKTVISSYCSHWHSCPRATCGTGSLGLWWDAFFFMIRRKLCVDMNAIQWHLFHCLVLQLCIFFLAILISDFSQLSSSLSARVPPALFSMPLPSGVTAICSDHLGNPCLWEHGVALRGKDHASLPCLHRGHAERCLPLEGDCHADHPGKRCQSAILCCPWKHF